MLKLANRTVRGYSRRGGLSSARRRLAAVFCLILAASPAGAAGVIRTRTAPAGSSSAPRALGRIAAPLSSSHAGPSLKLAPALSPALPAPAVPPIPSAAPAAAPDVQFSLTPTPSRMPLGAESFKVGDELVDISDPEVQKKLKAARERGHSLHYLTAARALPNFDLQLFYEIEHPELEIQDGDDEATRKGKRAAIKAAAAGIAARIPELLEAPLRELLGRYAHRSESYDGYELVEIERGIEFWTELVSASDADRRVAARAFLRTQTLAGGGKYERVEPKLLVQSITDSLHTVTRVANAEAITRPEWEALAALAGRHGRRATLHGRYALLGEGHSYHLARRVIEKGMALREPAQRAKFERSLRHLAAAGVGINVDEHQGAAAYYSPLGDELAYVMPSRATLNATTHEATHARFQRFQASLAKWAKDLGLAVPYQVDGPAVALFADYGGYMNLLNELNSWRIGESFDAGMPDKKILATLRRAYGAQAGWENVRRFGRLWPASRVKGRSVARLIRDEVRALNGLDAAGLAALGERARRGDVVAAHNFMRLTLARHKDVKSAPAELRAVLEALRAHKDSGVRYVANRVLGRKPPKGDAWVDPAKTAKKLLKILKTMSRAKQERALGGLLREAFTEDGPEHPGRREKAAKILEKLLDNWGFKTIYEPEELASINQMDKAWAESKSKKPHVTRARNPRPEHVLFSRSLDRLLAEGMFDGARSVHRLDLVNLIRTRTYPSELPLLHKRLIKAITSDRADRDNVWLARMFLVPGGTFFNAHLAWGESVAEAVRRDPTPSETALEFTGMYYRVALPASLPGPRWGKWARTRLDAATRHEARDALATMGPGRRRHYDRAVTHLGRMLAHPSEKVRVSARYAATAYPGYLLGLEERLARAVASGEKRRSIEAREVIAMTEPGFLPVLEAAIPGR